MTTVKIPTIIPLVAALLFGCVDINIGESSTTTPGDPPDMMDMMDTTGGDGDGEPGETETDGSETGESGGPEGLCCDCDNMSGAMYECMPAQESDCTDDVWCLDYADCEAACVPEPVGHWCCDCEAAPPFQCVWTTEPCIIDANGFGTFECEGVENVYPADCLAATCGDPGWCCECASFTESSWNCTVDTDQHCNQQGWEWCDIEDPAIQHGCIDACAPPIPGLCCDCGELLGGGEQPCVGSGSAGCEGTWCPIGQTELCAAECIGS